MGATLFYHLTRAPLEVTLPMLLARAREAGMTVVVRGTDAGRMDWLDQRLWLGPEEGFLPHGLEGGPYDALQPILLTTSSARPNGARCVMAVDGAEVSPDEVAEVDRACILFDGNDPAAVEHARGQWKALTSAGCSAQYWTDAGGRWEKKAEAGANG